MCILHRTGAWVTPERLIQPSKELDYGLFDVSGKEVIEASPGLSVLFVNLVQIPIQVIKRHYDIPVFALETAHEVGNERDGFLEGEAFKGKLIIPALEPAVIIPDRAQDLP